MIDIVFKIMVGFLLVLFLAMKQIKQGRFSELGCDIPFPWLTITMTEFTKKLLQEIEIDAVLQRLDRLTQDEVGKTFVQTIHLIHSLVGNVKIVMEGAEYSDDHLQMLF